MNNYLYGWQLEALSSWLRCGRSGIIEAVTGSGITKERAKWKQSKYRAPTDDERKAYADAPRFKSLPRATRATMHGGSPEDMIKYYADGDKKKERRLRRFFKKNPELFEGLSTDAYS